jgi:S-formylglutathione hydrolase FrmB
MMVALPDLAKLYAPYFSFSLTGNALTVTHHFFNKKVISGAGGRSPNMEYTKIVTVGKFTMGGTDGTKTVSTYAPVTTTPDGNFESKIDAAAIAATVGPTAVVLDLAPSITDGVIYVPVASFLTALGKTITTDSGFIAASSVPITDMTNDLFNPTYQDRTTAPYKAAGITALRVAYMNGILSGATKTGTFWHGFHMGDVAVFNGQYDASGKDITEVTTVNRILPYRLYVPKNYNPNVPSKFTFLLHGQTGSENATFERPNDHLANQPSPIPGLAHDSVENYSDVYNYIVLSPNGWTRGPDWGKGVAEQSMFISYNMARLTYNIDTNKTFVMGNSQGGGGALNFSVRHPEMFKAISVQAPVGGPSASGFKGAILDLPLQVIQGTADTTWPYGRTVTYYKDNIKGVMHDEIFMAVEQGHHSYAWASVFEAMYQFFDRALTTVPAFDVKEVFFTAGSRTAHQTNSTNQVQELLLTTAPVLAADGTTLMVALADLARIYGPTFNYYKVYAYNTVIANLASAVTTSYNHLSVNIALPGVAGNVLTPTYLRVGPALHTGDSGTTAADTFDTRTLAVAPSTDANGNILVPVVEFMNLFGKIVNAY